MEDMSGQLADDTLERAAWRGIGRELFADPTCRRPEIASAAVFGAELARTLNATLTDAYRGDPATPPRRLRRRFATASGVTIDVDLEAARVLVASNTTEADYALDVTMLPTGISIAYQGAYGGEALCALYLLDYLHEQGELPTDPVHLSGAQLAHLSELRLGGDDAPMP